MRFEDYVQHERKESMYQGMQKGIQQGMQKGIQHGMQKGIQQGIQERNREICLSMLKDGMSLTGIQKYTGLSEEEILAIKNNAIKLR